MRLDDLAEKWLHNCKNKGTLKDTLILEQFINMLPAEVRIFVRERQPKNSTEAAKIADDYILARKQEGALVRSEPQKKKALRNSQQDQRCAYCARMLAILQRTAELTSTERGVDQWRSL